MNPIQSHFMTMKKVIMSPKIFFDELNAGEGYKKVLIFTIINTILAFIVSIIFSSLFAGSKGINGLGIMLAGSLFIIPFILVILFVAAAILHVIAKILGGKGSYNGSFLVIGYSTALMPFTAIPVIGMIIALYHFYIEIVGFRKIHQYSTARAVVTVIIPVFIFVILVIAVIAVVGVAFLGILQSSGMNLNDLQNLQNIESIDSVQNIQEMTPEQLQQQVETMQQNIDDGTNTDLQDNITAYPTGYDAYQ